MHTRLSRVHVYLKEKLYLCTLFILNNHLRTIEMDRTVVELAVRDYNKPLGVATFRIGEDAPEKYNNILPDVSGLNDLLQENEEK